MLSNLILSEQVRKSYKICLAFSIYQHSSRHIYKTKSALILHPDEYFCWKFQSLYHNFYDILRSIHTCYEVLNLCCVGCGATIQKNFIDSLVNWGCISVTVFNNIHTYLYFYILHNVCVVNGHIRNWGKPSFYYVSWFKIVFDRIDICLSLRLTTPLMDFKVHNFRHMIYWYIFRHEWILLKIDWIGLYFTASPYTMPYVYMKNILICKYCSTKMDEIYCSISLCLRNAKKKINK